ncbi:MAG: transposase [Rhodocyclaceae bacterium]|nr:transposase [Rhodocyclaceae bacterium]
MPCAQRDKCLRKPDKTPAGQVCFFRGRASGGKVSHTEIMKRAIDSERGRALYGGRFATVEPVFGNIRHNKRLNRFTLRGRTKVDAQWKLFCLGAQHREAGAPRLRAVVVGHHRPALKVSLRRTARNLARNGKRRGSFPRRF